MDIGKRRGDAHERGGHPGHCASYQLLQLGALRSLQELQRSKVQALRPLPVARF